MTDEFETMPDFLGELEDDLLKRAAAQPASRRWPHSAWVRPIAGVSAAAVWPRPVGALLAAALALSLLLHPGSVGRDSDTAYGQPPILKITPIPLNLGAIDAELTQARPFTVLGKPAKLLSGSGMWCISLPHRNPGELVDVPAVSCVKSAIFFRYGVTLSIGRTFVAVLPGDVRAPTLKHADGQRVTLHPDGLGVVAVRSLEPGESVTRYGTNGHPRISAHVPAGS